MVSQKLENESVDGATRQKSPPSPKSRLAVLKRNKKPAATSDPFRFQGQGVTYKGKLIGEQDVEGARGDGMCGAAMTVAKKAIKDAGAHKTRIQLQINIDGIKIVDEKSGAILHNFPVSKISFIARDTTDARAFGLVFSTPDNKYKFFGIKTAQTADHAVLAIRDMFQVVFEMKKKHIDQVKLQHENSDQKESGDSGVAVADLVDLETELEHIERGVQNLQSIPVDPFGATPFADPFQNSFNTTSSTANSSLMTSSMNASSLNASGFSQQTQNVMDSSFPPVQQVQQSHQQPWPQMAAPISQTAPQNAWGVPSMPQTQPQVYQNLTHAHSQPVFGLGQPSQFSETNPFASVASHAAPVPAPVPAPTPAYDVFSSAFTTPSQNLAAPVANNIDWGNSSKENQLPHANTFSAFDDNTFKGMDTGNRKEEESKRVTSLEEAFTKLVDMDALIGPSETKKNPFEHILNPPKATLNTLSTPQQRPAMTTATADPFGDDFFR